MAGEVLLVTQFLAAGLMLLLAGWLLYLNFHSRVVRAFSLFLLVRAMNILSNQFGRVFEAPEYWEGVRGYYDLAVVPALAYFLLVFAGSRRPTAVKVGGWALVAVTILIEALYAADHCLAFCTTGVSPQRVIMFGPLGVLVTGFAVAYAVVAITLVLHAKRTAFWPRRAGARLVAGALLLNALLESSLVLASFAVRGPEAYLSTFAANEWQWVAPIIFGVAALSSLVGLVLLVADGRSARDRRFSWFVVAASAAVVLTGIILSVYKTPDAVLFPVIGAWRLSLPILVAVALLRHRLFGLDLKARHGIRQGTVAAIFLAVFFAANKIVENLVADRFGDGNFGIYAGGAVAGILLFAISPLQRLGERVATAALPSQGAFSKAPLAERQRFFQEQAEIAWSDGVLGHRERALLEQLRARLALSAEDALRLENAAASAQTVSRKGASRARAMRKAHAEPPG